MASAFAVLERTGNEHAVTLPAANSRDRRASPADQPSVTSPAEIVAAVVVAEQGTLADARTSAAAFHASPAEGLLAAARYSLELDRSYSNGFRVVLERRPLPDWPQRHKAMTAAPLMAAAHVAVTGLVQACVDTGRSTVTDANIAVVAIWFTLHS